MFFLKRLKFFFPNFFTVLNLIYGSIGLFFLLFDNILHASIFFFFGMFFDFFDGFIARFFNVYSLFGKCLDSFSDLITFGLLPSFIFYKILNIVSGNDYLFLIILSFLVFSSIRLSNFNIFKNNLFIFKGISVPINSSFIIFFFYFFFFEKKIFLKDLIGNFYLLFFLFFLFSYFLIVDFFFAYVYDV
ncbi:MAG: CDP-alcohol phosphatidyltransferase family protein [Cytophagales bacterium]